MRYLLDTHTVLWAFNDYEKLSPEAEAALSDTDSEACVSVASVWEVAIKASTGKLEFPGGATKFVETVERNGFRLLNIESPHVLRVESLPFIHRDPFDRLLVATALVEDMRLVTADENIRRYEVNCVW
ncbi:MAG: type II toxin-antitoxin system VapC family toxin [Azoarcus sp.]|jgi:PIN domain nuclease of toxin-antitoxin system|nr:type II toxin-antitoxin system VapC family toxin [Azoarcus sp.]